MFVKITADYRPEIGDVLKAAGGNLWQIYHVWNGYFDVRYFHGARTVTAVTADMFLEVQKARVKII